MNHFQSSAVPGLVVCSRCSVIRIAGECRVSGSLPQSFPRAVFSIFLGGRSLCGLLGGLWPGWVGSYKHLFLKRLGFCDPPCVPLAGGALLCSAVRAEKSSTFCALAPGLRAAEPRWEPLWEAALAVDICQPGQMPHKGQGHRGIVCLDCIRSSMAEVPV